MNAIGYVRCSSEEQATHGLSLDAQEASVRAYCALHGFNLVDLVVDAGISAGKPLYTRQGGKRVLASLKAGKAQVVIGTKLDRLFRRASDCLETVAHWNKQGVSLVLLDLGGQSINTSSAAGTFTLTLLAAVGEMERNLIRERTAWAMSFKRSKGEHTGTAPYGQQVASDGVHLEPNADEQKALNRIATLRKQGLSIRNIVSALNAEGVQARGERWHFATVQAILKRAA